MKAYSHSQYGAPSVLHCVDLPKPTPKDDEVLIRVYATTVSSGDWRARSLTVPAGMGWIARLVFGVRRPRKPVLGTDLSGVIEAVGAAVSKFKPGDAVIAFPGAKFGAHAEFRTMPENGAITMKPDNLNFAEAAALPFGGTTAYDFLINKAQLRPGGNILVNGATGATGSAIVQLAKHFGARVTAVCSTPNIALAKSLGADAVIDYTQHDFTELDRKFDMIVDTVGNAPWARSKPALGRNGRLVIVSGGLIDMIFGPIRAWASGKRVIGGVASEDPGVLETVVGLAKAGHWRPIIDRCYGFDAMIDAHRHVDSGRKKGNVVVEVADALVRAAE